jgi:CheY-like chemotaxis protein
MPQHILVVDDDPLLVSCISRYLKAAGYTTCSAGDGVSGEQRACADHPDLVLLDMRMAGRSGLETLAALRNSAETCHLPVIMLSGSDEDFDAARSAGAAGVLLKPFRQAELVSAVQRALKASATPAHPAGPARQLEQAYS